jgi:flagellar biosynthesis protein FliQ
LDNLRRKYSLLSFFVKIYVAILLVALIAGLTVAIMGAFKS